MIFGGQAACESKRKQKLTHRKIYAAEPATLSFLWWSDSAITYDRSDNPEQVPCRCLAAKPAQGYPKQ